MTTGRVRLPSPPVLAVPITVFPVHGAVEQSKYAVTDSSTP